MNIYALKIDKSLNEMAQRLANKCMYNHSLTPDVGENVYKNTGHLSQVEALKQACAWWWKEFVDVGLREDLVLTEVDVHRIGHATQMASSVTTLVGCAVNWCSTEKPPGTGGFTLVFCNYRPLGNLFGAKVYEKGEPCHRPSDCTTHKDSGCDADAGLCLLPK